MRRSSGVLLHITSLPSVHGVGDLGPEAHRFVRFLKDARQSWWQMFPLGPTTFGNSPYQVLSAFAGNPLFISLERLHQLGLLRKSDLDVSFPATSSVDYDAAWRFKKRCLKKAYAAFVTRKKEQPAFDAFCRREADWLDNYALYCAIKQSYRGAAWEKWSPELRDRDPRAIDTAWHKLGVLVRYHQFLQYMFFLQWRELRSACKTARVNLMGDIPIFVAHDSADVWANRDLFYLDKSGRSTYVAGCPPDYFSRTGQRWGNPLYRWDVLKKNGYRWWVRRFEKIFQFFDAARIDHFIGFHNYWRIPASHRTAVGGRWMPGPGADLFRTVVKKLGRLPIVAEDLGALTPEVTALREQFGFPGMRVLQFAFSGDPANTHLPQNFVRRTVVYTGTHDNDTTVGWFEKINADEKRRVRAYLNSSGKEIHWDMIRGSLSSTAAIAITPAQDLLGLPSNARMNMPGTSRGNWRWRLTPRQLGPKQARRLRELTERYDRA